MDHLHGPFDFTAPAAARHNFELTLDQVLPNIGPGLRQDLLKLATSVYPHTIDHIPLALTCLLSLRPKNLGISAERLEDIAVAWNVSTRHISGRKLNYDFSAYRSPLLHILAGINDIFYSDFKRWTTLASASSNLIHIRWIVRPEHIEIPILALSDSYNQRKDSPTQHTITQFAELLINIYRSAIDIANTDLRRLRAYKADHASLLTVAQLFAYVYEPETVTTTNFRGNLAKWIIDIRERLINEKITADSLRYKLNRALSLVLTEPLLQQEQFALYRTRSIGTSMRAASTEKDNPASPASPRAGNSGSPKPKRVLVSTSRNLYIVESLPPRSRTVVPFRLPGSLPPPAEHAVSGLPPIMVINPSCIATIRIESDSRATSRPEVVAPSTDDIVRRSSPSIATRQKIDSLFDPHRLSPVIIVSFLDQIAGHNPLLAAYLWLCLFTGINWRILVDLQCGTDPRPPGTELPHLDLKTGFLTYLINNGATPFLTDGHGDSPNRVMTLSLPDMVLKVFRQSSSVTPFAEIDEQLQLQAKYFMREFLVPRTPTPERLTATFATTVGTFGGHFNELEIACIQGDVPFHLRAQVKYPQFDLQRLNQQHRAAVTDYSAYLLQIAPGTRHRDWLCPTYQSQLPLGVIGSQVYCPPKVFGRMLSSLYKQFSTIHRTTGRHAHRDKLSDWVALINLQQLNLYVIEQVSLGFRPVGMVVDIQISEPQYGCLVRDKSSAKHTELTHSPVLPILKDQIAACRLGIQRFRRFLRSIDSALEDPEEAQRSDLAIVASANSLLNPAVVRLSRMRGTDSEQLLVEFGLDKEFERPVDAANTFRHFLATELTRSLSPVSLSEFLGHQRNGHEYYSPWSTVRGPYLAKVAQSLEPLIQQLGLRVLRILL